MYIYTKNTIIMIKYTPKTIKFISIINSLIHSFLISFVSILYLLNYVCFNTIKKYYIFSITYFIIDYIIILIYFDLKNKIVFLFHHFISIYCLYIFVFEIKKDDNLNNLIVQAFTSELPIIFLNINSLLIKYKNRNTKIFKISNYLMIITYFLFRICNFTYILFLNYYKYDFLNKLFSIIYMLNCIWFVLLFKRFQNDKLNYHNEKYKKN